MGTRTLVVQACSGLLEMATPQAVTGATSPDLIFGTSRRSCMRWLSGLTSGMRCCGEARDESGGGGSGGGGGDRAGSESSGARAGGAEANSSKF